jgi:tyrosyl-tRNA synthetase
MSLPDGLLESYYQLLTDLPMEECRPFILSKPRDAKVGLAKHIITWLHDKEAADAAEEQFVKVFAHKETPDEMPEFQVGAGPHKLTHLLVKAQLAASNGEASRKIKEKAVSIDGEKVAALDVQKELTIDKPTVLKLGRKFARLLP